ncbi:MAG: hypothetical protein H7X89_04955 [Rhizobiales bacterium]|nr:hypothetical protein [Hyphomicrobiales bacterium]
MILDFGGSELVQFDGRALSFGNANGEDILVYPSVALMPRRDGQFALIDIREISLDFRSVQFVEEDAVPADAKVVHETWAKVNKNGSPDLRFKGNYRIPVCLYGRLLFTSPGGLREEYQFSNIEAVENFSRAFDAYKITLPQLGVRVS